MALGDAYATVSALEERLNESDNGSFADILDAASRHVELYTKRQFNQTDTATARRFRALDPERLPVDDFYTTTDLSVTIAGDTWDTSQYDPRPWDGVVGGQTVWPYSDLFAVGRSWPTFKRRATVEVTARWGWSAVPGAIVEATLDVAEIMTQGAGVGSAGSFIVSERIGDVSVGFGTPRLDLGRSDVPGALIKADKYRRKVFGIG